MIRAWALGVCWLFLLAARTGWAQGPEAPEAQADSAASPTTLRHAPAANDGGEGFREAPILPQPRAEDGRAYGLSSFEFVDDRRHPELPGEAKLLQTRVALLQTNRGYVAPREGLPPVRVQLAELSPDVPRIFFGSAVRQVCVALVRTFNEAGVVGVYVGPHPADIGPQGQDLRPERQTKLRLVIRTAVAGDVRTLARGSRQQPEINPKQHERIRRLSPVQPTPTTQPETESPTADEQTDLLRQDLINDYLHRLNRHPDRRVDVAIAAGGTEAPGGASVDYLVNETRPWHLFARTSNTGTEATGEWRQTFGFVHNQLTNHDDIFNLTYSTAGFDDVHALAASYSRPFPASDRWRWRVDGGYSRYTAEDIGLADTRFEGENWRLGGEIAYNAFQRGRFFVDAYAGARLRHVSTDNVFVDDGDPGTVDVINQGEETFLLPFVGLRAEYPGLERRLFGSIELQANPGGILFGHDQDELEQLGRLEPDIDWLVLNFDLSYSVFLEPLLNRRAWENVNTPSSSTLAHELAVRLQGQYSFANRLPPQFQRSLGGLYTVRGHPEAVLAADSLIVGSLEYRFHVPRVFPIVGDPSRTPLLGQPFRFAPQRVYGQPDWDLVLKAFFDAGKPFQSGDLDNLESEEGLLAAGVGLELQLKRLLNLRVDVGWPLDDVPGEEVQAGEPEVHVVGSLYW